MKRTSLAVLMLALALVALVAPLAYAQAPAPKVTINGLIDNVTTYSQNISNYNGGLLNRKDSMWWGRTRGRFDFIGEVGKAKGVLGLEIDMVYGQTGSGDSNVATPGAQVGFGTDGSFDLNTDSRGILELKWLYVEFPMPWVPVPTTVRLGAQPFGAAANYKLAAYATGDFAGVNIVSQVTPNVKLVWTFAQVEESLVGTDTRNKPGTTVAGVAQTQNRGDDYALIVAPEITPFKGLDIKPLISTFYAQGTTSGSARQGRGGINTSTNFTTAGGQQLGGMNEYRHTVGLDARMRMGPFSLDPTVLYQFGNRGVNMPSSSGGAFNASGVPLDGTKRYAKLDAWLIDVRGGFQLGPLLIEGLAMYTTGNTARNNTLGTVRSFQPLTTDTGYLADWGTALSSLGIDYLNAWNEAGGRIAYPGVSIGFDKYGRMQFGAKATYAVTPELSVMGGASGIWTAEAVDRNGSVSTAGTGITPVFAGPTPRDNKSYVGTELHTTISWRFAPGLTWDNQFAYMFMGPALDAVTDPTWTGRNTNDPFILTSRIRFTF